MKKNTNFKDLIVYIAFFLSGISGLIYQISFERVLQRIVGVTLPSLSIVLCLFMCGLALGSVTSGRKLDRINKPLLVYAFLELGLAVWTIIFNALTSSSTIEKMLAFTNNAIFCLNPIADQFLWFYVLILILVPTTLMGAILPCITRYFAIESNTIDIISLDCHINRAYYVNIVGAIIGTILSGFIFIPQLGLRFTTIIAGVINVLIAIILIATTRAQTPYKERTISAINAESTVSIETNNPPIFNNQLGSVLAVLVSGILGMMLEIIFIRLSSLLLGSSTYAMSSVIATFLIGLALGAAVSTKYVSRIHNVNFATTYLLIGLGLILWADLWIVQHLLQVFLLTQKFVEHIFGTTSFTTYILCRATTISTISLIPSFLLGCIFPVSISSLVKQRHKASLTVSQLAMFNITGSAFGALAMGHILMPWLCNQFVSGIQSALIFCSIFTSMMALIIAIITDTKKILTVLLVLVLVGLTCFHMYPQWDTTKMSSGISFLDQNNTVHNDNKLHKTDDELLFYREGLNTTVTVGRINSANITYLKNDGKVEAAIPSDLTKPSTHSDLTTQVLLGLLPIIICSESPQNVFVIGYGSGTTCNSIINCPEVIKVTVAELEKAIYQCSRYFRHINDENKQAKNKAQLVALTADARNVLAFSHDQFQVIISQPAEPWIAGSSELYTQEFWKLAKSRLTSRGIFCQWIQLYAINPEYLAVLLRTFKNVFPLSIVFHTTGAGEIIIVGFNNSPTNQETENDIFHPFNYASMQRRINYPGIHNQLTRLGFCSSTQLLESFLLSPKAIDSFCQQIGKQSQDFKINTDDTLLTEYALPKSLMQSKTSIKQNLEALQSSYKREEVYQFINGTNILWPASNAERYQKSAQKFFHNNKMEEALAALRLAIKFDPSCPNILTDLGILLARQGNYKESLELLDKSLSINPDQFEARFIFGKLLCKFGYELKGLEQIFMCSQQRPEDLEPNLYITSYYCLHGKWQLAKQNLAVLYKKSKGDKRYQLLVYAVSNKSGEKNEATTALIADKYKQLTDEQLDYSLNKLIDSLPSHIKSQGSIL